MSSITADAEDKFVPRVHHHHHHINWHHHVSDSKKSGKGEREKKRRVHGSIGLIVPEMIVETNGTRRAQMSEIAKTKNKMTKEK